MEDKTVAERKRAAREFVDTHRAWDAARDAMWNAKAEMTKHEAVLENLSNTILGLSPTKRITSMLASYDAVRGIADAMVTDVPE